MSRAPSKAAAKPAAKPAARLLTRSFVRTTILADTGALYALMDASDAWHGAVRSWWAEDALKLRDIRIPATVLPELCFLLATQIGPEAETAFVRAVAAGEFTVEPLDDDDYERIAQLTTEYRDLPLGFVDASLVALAERLDVKELLTTDRRHFHVVRPQHTRQFTLSPVRS